MNDILLQVLAEDKKLITYRKELNKLTGSITATILLQQLIFHSSNKKYKPFYKFIEPCNNELYRTGDSWVEELGFSKYEFKSAYTKLETLGIVSKKISMNRVTYYSLNKSTLGKLVKSVYDKSFSIEKEPSNDHDSEGLTVNEESFHTKSQNINIDNRKNKKQKTLDDDEEERKINLNFIDEYINEITNNRKKIKGSYTSYKSSVMEALENALHKRHKKTLRSYQVFVEDKEKKIEMELIPKLAIEQLDNIIDIDSSRFINKRIRGKYDEGTISYVQQIDINTYKVVYAGLAVFQSQPLVHTEEMSSQKLQSSIIMQNK